MLYEKKRYQDVREVFNIIKSRQIQGGMYPKHVVVLVFAACYKEVSKPNDIDDRVLTYPLFTIYPIFLFLSFIILYVR